VTSSSRRDGPILKQKSWEEQNYGHVFQRGPKPRLTVLARASKNLPDSRRARDGGCEVSGMPSWLVLVASCQTMHTLLISINAKYWIWNSSKIFMYFICSVRKARRFHRTEKYSAYKKNCQGGKVRWWLTYRSKHVVYQWFKFKVNLKFLTQVANETAKGEGKIRDVQQDDAVQHFYQLFYVPVLYP
jgi:hypothetical protein